MQNQEHAHIILYILYILHTCVEAWGFGKEYICMCVTDFVSVCTEVTDSVSVYTDSDTVTVTWL